MFHTAHDNTKKPIVSPRGQAGDGGSRMKQDEITRSAGEQGQALLEYTFLLVLVAMVVLIVLMIFGPELTHTHFG